MSQQGKYLEIERRWLLSGLPDFGTAGAISVKAIHTNTIYILHDPSLEVRIRQRKQFTPEQITFPVVMKIGQGIVRQESPRLLADVSIFQYYKNLYPPLPRLERMVWEITLSTNQKWEISICLIPEAVRNLVLVEMEFPTVAIATCFKKEHMPAWLLSQVVKEVTDDPRYNGKNLAVHGRPNPE